MAQSDLTRDQRAGLGCPWYRLVVLAVVVAALVFVYLVSALRLGKVTVPDTDDDRCPACGGDVDVALVGVVTIDDRTESVDSGMCSTCGKRLSRPLGSRQWRM